MTDYYEYSIPELVQLLGTRFKDYRLRSNMTQKDVAKYSGLSVNTIHKFENGLVPNMSISTFLLLMKAIIWFTHSIMKSRIRMCIWSRFGMIPVL